MVQFFADRGERDLGCAGPEVIGDDFKITQVIRQAQDARSGGGGECGGPFQSPCLTVPASTSPVAWQGNQKASKGGGAVMGPMLDHCV